MIDPTDQEKMAEMSRRLDEMYYSASKKTGTGSNSVQSPLGDFTQLKVKRTIFTLPVGGNIQDAIDVLNAESGGEIRLAAGTYTMSKDITLRSNVALVGSGRDATFIVFTGAYSITAGAVGSFRLEGFSVGSSTASAAIVLTSSFAFRIENVSSSGNIDGYLLTGCSFFQILNSFASNNSANGFDIIGCTDGMILNCYCESNTGYNYSLDSSCIGVSLIGSDLGDPSTSPAAKGSILGRTNAIVNTYSSPVTERRTRYVKNTSGGTITAGNVVTLKAVASGEEVTTTTTAGDDKVWGVALETAANNAYFHILVEGMTTALTVNGTTDIAIGDFLATFTTAGIAYKASAGDQTFAMALEAYTTNDSAGVIDALVFSPRLI